MSGSLEAALGQVSTGGLGLARLPQDAAKKPAARSRRSPRSAFSAARRALGRVLVAVLDRDAEALGELLDRLVEAAAPPCCAQSIASPRDVAAVAVVAPEVGRQQRERRRALLVERAPPPPPAAAAGQVDPVADELDEVRAFADGVDGGLVRWHRPGDTTWSRWTDCLSSIGRSGGGTEMGLFSRMKVEMPSAGGRAPGPRAADAGDRAALRARHADRRRRSRRGPSSRCSAWAASGAPSGCSGSSTASTPRRSATRRATRRTRRTRRSARRAPATTRSSGSCSTPRSISYEQLLAAFWEGHDPTQGMRQGNDVGTQYRSGDLHVLATRSARPPRPARRVPGARSPRPGYGAITTEIEPAGEFYYAEDYHQQYLAKVPERLLRPRRHRGELPGRARHRLTDPPGPSAALLNVTPDVKVFGAGVAAA